MKEGYSRYDWGVDRSNTCMLLLMESGSGTSSSDHDVQYGKQSLWESWSHFIVKAITIQCVFLSFLFRRTARN